nr:MAG TPA: hypothetical protein [Caudoviricetes sp.]
MGVIDMADTPVLIPPGLVGMVNVGGGGKLREIRGSLNYSGTTSTVVITGIPFEPKFYWVGGYYTYTGAEECGIMMEERGLVRVRYTAGEDTGGNGNYYFDLNEGDGFINATYSNGVFTVPASPAFHRPTDYVILG